MPSATHTVYYIGIVISVMTYSVHTPIIWYGHQWHDRRHQSPHLAPPSSSTVIITISSTQTVYYMVSPPPSITPSGFPIILNCYHNDLLYSNGLLYGIVIGGLTAAITVHPIWPLHHLRLVIIMNTAATTQIAVGPYFQVLFSSEAPDPSSIK
ncbi:hypothetical protein INT47_002869 [Mucor saturninus]|uniref:Uncharacterized protein n=1 Tax=Mucor saturninus TaxID=64648 RepID=A0A8H7QGS5_9FUNG|nr:hypothetical protein INT47_002869 [Mucor saturninus]